MKTLIGSERFMQKIRLLAETVCYIEDHLTDELSNDDIAAHLFCSKSAVEKMFRYWNGMSIHDYIIRRRMSRAARDISENPSISLLQLAMKYGYDSNEAFTRAFVSVWHMRPSDYRKMPGKTELFPRFSNDVEILEDKRMNGRVKVDISELYDLLKQRVGCYVVCSDIRNLIPFNDISMKFGDVAILEALRRMEEAAGEDDIVFRTGGDEFVMLTNSKDAAYARSMEEKIIRHNGEKVTWNNEERPLSLYVVSFQMRDGNLRYSELFTEIQNQIQNAK